MSKDDDSDRAAILRRRTVFVLSTLASVGLGTACEQKKDDDKKSATPTTEVSADAGIAPAATDAGAPPPAVDDAGTVPPSDAGLTPPMTSTGTGTTPPPDGGTTTPSDAGTKPDGGTPDGGPPPQPCLKVMQPTTWPSAIPRPPTAIPPLPK